MYPKLAQAALTFLSRAAIQFPESGTANSVAAMLAQIVSGELMVQPGQAGRPAPLGGPAPLQGPAPGAATKTAKQKKTNK